MQVYMTIPEAINDIKSNLKQRSASTKDEVTIMQSMLNDKDYSVEVYRKNGKNYLFCPAKEFRTMISGIVSNTTKINKEEATALVESYDFKRNEAQTLIDVSKEFINTYLDTGRKLKLGGRKDSDVSLIKKDYEAGLRRYPSRIGIGEDGKTVIEPKEIWVDSYSGVKASSPCPSWVKKAK